MTDGKDYSEARFTVHHASVPVCGTFQGNRFDHRTNVFEVAERQDILDVKWRCWSGFPQVSVRRI
jgi:hypothetical protein